MISVIAALFQGKEVELFNNEVKKLDREQGVLWIPKFLQRRQREKKIWKISCGGFFEESFGDKNGKLSLPVGFLAYFLTLGL